MLSCSCPTDILDPSVYEIAKASDCRSPEANKPQSFEKELWLANIPFASF
jgi:hypothetical protein